MDLELQSSIRNFRTRFPTEATCNRYLFRKRWPKGFVCPKCGGTNSSQLKCRAYTHECIGCGRQTSITAGTIMHRSKLPLSTWLLATELLKYHPKQMTVRKLMECLSLHSYKTAWLLTKKIKVELEAETKRYNETIYAKNPKPETEDYSDLFVVE